MEPEGSSLELSTIQQWSVDDSFKYQSEVRNGVEIVVQVNCELCGKYLQKIKIALSVKRQIQNEVEIIASGTDNVKEHAILRHLGGGAQKIAVVYKKLSDPQSH